MGSIHSLYELDITITSAQKQNAGFESSTYALVEFH